MNKIEAASAATLEQRKHAGKVAGYKFGGPKFRLAENTFYTPDFTVLLTDGAFDVFEIKEHWQDDVRAKIKIAGNIYSLLLQSRPN